MEKFDFTPVMREMLDLFDERTDNWVSDDPDWKNSDHSTRVTWEEMYDCMKRHGYTGGSVDAQLDFEKQASGQWYRVTRMIRQKYGEISGGNL